MTITKFNDISNSWINLRLLKQHKWKISKNKLECQLIHSNLTDKCLALHEKNHFRGKLNYLILGVDWT